MKINFFLGSSEGGDIFTTLSMPCIWNLTSIINIYSSRISFFTEKDEIINTFNKDQVINKIKLFFTDKDHHLLFEGEMKVFDKEFLISPWILTLDVKKIKISHFYIKNTDGNISPIATEFFPLFEIDFNKAKDEIINFLGDINCFLRFLNKDEGSHDQKIYSFLKITQENLKILTT